VNEYICIHIHIYIYIYIYICIYIYIAHPFTSCLHRVYRRPTVRGYAAWLTWAAMPPGAVGCASIVHTGASVHTAAMPPGAVGVGVNPRNTCGEGDTGGGDRGGIPEGYTGGGEEELLAEAEREVPHEGHGADETETDGINETETDGMDGTETDGETDRVDASDKADRTEGVGTCTASAAVAAANAIQSKPLNLGSG